MQLLRTEASDRASTEWHRCPLCGKVRLTSAPQSQRPAGLDDVIDDAYRADAPLGDVPGFFNDKPLYA